MVALVISLAAITTVAVQAQDVPYAIKWSVEISAAPMFPPVVGTNHILLAQLPGTIAAYSIADGKQVWRVALVPSAPPITDGELSFVAAGGEIHALSSADGTSRWHSKVGTVTSPILARNGWVVAVTESGIHAIRARDGSSVWTREAHWLRESPAISGDVLFVVTTDGWVRAHNLLNGDVIWERQMGGTPAEPLVSGDRVYFGASDKTFYCLDAADGELLWKWRLGATMRTAPSTDGTSVFFVPLDNLVRAIDARHGGLKWQQGVPFRALTGPAVVGQLVLVAGTEIRLLNIARGKPAGSISFPDKLGIAPAITQSPEGPLVAAVTGSLAESWKLSLAAPKAAESAK